MEHDTRSGDVTQHGQLATLTSVADALACWEALEPASRETWLAELAKVQPRVAAEVESLSRFVRTGDVLEEPAGPLVMAVDAGRMPRVGDVVGEYTLTRVIGAGGFGVVLEARGAGGERVAVKVLRESLAATSARERFEAEARILQSLKHPGIATFIAAGTREGLPYLVQSFVDGRDVRTHCEQSGADASARVRLVCEALEAIAHAHAQGVIHRDIKAANVLVTADGRVSVIDFGIARQSEQPGVTRTGQRVGTTAYMSPEQLEASGDVTASADVYAMAVVLYELLTGHLPYDPVLFAREPERAIRVGGVLPMSRWTQAVPGAIEDVVRRALRKQPGDRYSDASGFAAALRAALAGMRPENVWTKSAFAVRRFTRRYGALAAAAGIGVGVVTWLAIDRASTRRENASLAAKASSAVYIDTLQAAADALRKKDNSGARETLKSVDEAQRGPEWRWMAAMAEPAPVVREYREAVWNVDGDADGLILSLGNGDLTMLSRDGSVLWRSEGMRKPKAFAVLPRGDGDLIASCDSQALYLHRKRDGVEVDHPAKQTPGLTDIAAYGEGAVALWERALVFADFRSPVMTLLEFPASQQGNSVAVDEQTGMIVVATACKKSECDAATLIGGKMVEGKWQQVWQNAITHHGAHALLMGTDPASGRRIVIGCSLDKSVFVYDLVTGEAMAPMPDLPQGTWGADLHADGQTIAVGTIRGEVAIAKVGDKAWKYNRRHRNYARVAWDGDSVISGSWDKSLRFGDSLLRDSSGLTPTSNPRLFAFSDGPIVATWIADGNTQYVMRATGERSELSVTDRVLAVAITGETVWTGDADGRVTRVGRNGEGVEQVLPHPVHAMVVAEGASGPVAYAFEVNGVCSVVDGTTMSVRHVAKANVRDGFADVFTDDAQAAMVVSNYGDVTRVETTGAVSKVGPDSVGAGAAHVDGKRVLFATCGHDPTEVKVSESPNRLMFRTQLGGFSASNPVFTRDGSRVLVGLESGAVAVVGVPDGKLIATIPVGETPVIAVYVTRDDRLVTLDKRGVVRQIAAWGANAQPVVQKKLAHAEVRVVPAVWTQPAADVRDAAIDGESPDLVGVGALPLTGAPGPLLALGEAKSLIDGPDGSGSVLVQANVGKGVVFAFAHGGYLSGENIRKDANLRECMRRVVTWAHGREGAGAIVMSGAGKAVVEAIGGDVQWRTVQRDWRDALGEPGIVIVDTHQFTRAEDAANVRAFVERGGTLITSGLAWGWLQLNPGKTIAEHPGNVALVPMGIAFADGTLDGDKDNRYPVEVREHARGRDDIDVIMRVTRGEGGVERERVEGAVARTRLALRTLTAEQAKRFIGLDELMAESAEAMQASFARMPERGLRVDRDPLALLACEQFANVSFELPAAQVTQHPSAAAFPGLVDAAAERGERVVTVDTTIPGWRATGLFVPAGEVVRVTVDENLAKSGLRLQVGSHLDPALRGPLRRLPKVTREFAVTSATTEVASAVGGLLYLVVPEAFAETSVRVTVDGAVRAPHFVLGQTSVEAWREEIRSAPGPWGEIESRQIALTLPSELLRGLDDPKSLLELWDRIVLAQGSLEPRRLNGLGDRQARYVPDPHVSWGYMYAPADRPLTIPMSAAKNLIDAKMLASNSDGDAWGLFHELGHWHQNDMWTFDGTGEVTVNIFTLYTIDAICGLPSAKAREDVFTPAKMLDTMRKHVAQGSPFPKWKSDPFLALTMYVQMEQAFGWEAYRAVFAAYRALPQDKRPRSDEDERDMWMVMMSRQVGRDLGPFFAAWGVPVTERARASVAELPDWMPEGWSDPRTQVPKEPGQEATPREGVK